MTGPLPAKRLMPRLLITAALFFSIPQAEYVFCEGSHTYYVIKKGDTLYSVARSYDISPQALAKVNGITDPSKLSIGTKILIPQVHKVVKGDTLFSIAKTYGVSLESLRAINGFSESALIKPGDVLVLPSNAIKPASSQNAPAVAAGNNSKAPAAVSAPVPPPEALRLSSQSVSVKTTWPCAGEIAYLDGKAYGVVIKTALGESQRAVASGTVIFADIFRGYGRVVIVESYSGYIYVYAGNENISVKTGEKVKSGQELGKVGMDAKLGKPAAYFLVSKGGEAVDPAKAPRD